jgi:hypothetical protein
VIIVGTHRDKIKKPYPPDFVEKMGSLIDHLYVVSEPDKKGLPRVMGHVELSCRGGFGGRSYIKTLANLIWKVVHDEQLPGKLSIIAFYLLLSVLFMLSYVIMVNITR